MAPCRRGANVFGFAALLTLVAVCMHFATVVPDGRVVQARTCVALACASCLLVLIRRGRRSALQQLGALLLLIINAVIVYARY